MIQDSINATFELVGALIMLMNVYQIHKDKMVRGIHYSVVMFFSCWGFWNVYYYPFLDQWYSSIAAVFLAVTNTLYLSQIIYYTKKEKQQRG